MTDYEELHRPQFHFSAQKNWINDPNGLVYHQGVWHLFFQHNAEQRVWGKMWWGHAISEDLIHWRQVDHALYPDSTGTMFSGSAVVDHHNTAGFGAGAMLLFYTAAGSNVEPKRSWDQCLAYSLDGKTFIKFDGNPILGCLEGHNRDPKVIWHEASRHWIMALYLADDRFCLLRSPDAKTWTRIQDIPFEGERECPDLFLLKDDAGRERWVFTAAKGFYSVGDFNGEKFVPETAIRRFDLGTNSYAAQTWSNAPDRRCIQIAWMPGGLYPEMPFNQQLSIPVQLSLVGSGKNTSLYRWPVEELNRLRKNKLSVTRHTIAHGKPLIPETDAQLFDLSFTVHKLDAAALYLMIRGRPVILDWRSNTLTFEPSGINKVVGDRPQVELPSGTALYVRVLIDKTSLEFFFNGGQISASFCFLPDGYINPVVLNSFNGEQVIENLELYELQSSWRAS